MVRTKSHVAERLSALLTAAEKKLYIERFGDRLVTPLECKEYLEATSDSDILPVMQKVCTCYGARLQPYDLSTISRHQESVYPETDSSDFSTKLNRKQEFAELLSSNKGKTIDDLCPGDTQPFMLLPYQEYLTRFMSPLTPYHGLLVFHAVGTGKSATALSIAESFREQMQLNATPSQRKCLILSLNNSIAGTFRTNIYRARAEEDEIRNSMRPGSRQVTSDTYYVDDRTNRSELIKKRYEEFYDIVGSETFAKHVYNLKQEAQRVAPQRWEKRFARYIQDEYANRVIIVDEVHNIKNKRAQVGEEDVGEDRRQRRAKVEREQSSAYKRYDALQDVVRHAENVRLVLMSATPISHEPSEIVSVLNLLLVNDGLPEIQISDVFRQNDDHIDVFTAEGPKILRTKAAPYVSYVRGFNPISFPRELEPDDPCLKGLYSNNEMYMPRPLYALNPYVKTREFEKMSKASLMSHLKVIRCPMSRFQFHNYAWMINQIEKTSNVANREEFDLCSFIYPVDETQGKAGSEGFASCFKQLSFNKATRDRTYRYQPFCKDFLRSDQVINYSCKYWQILQNILRSPGIAFVYSERVQVGVETLAMMLDANGYERDGGGFYLQDHNVANGDKICSICNCTKRLHDATTGHPFRQARYMVMQHQDIATTNADRAERLKSPSNRMGEEVKVILGTLVTRESMDFSNVRQIHIATAWYNMSRIIQIVGRGIRNCSHRTLRPEDRNVTVFRYCVAPPKQRSDNIAESMYLLETGDEQRWKNAEARDVIIKRIERELKRVAIDCPINRDINTFETDKDGSRDCDYQACDYQCSGQLSPKQARDYTTSELLLNRNEVNNAKFVIGKLFEINTAYTFEEIQKHVAESRRKLGARAVALALQEMLGLQSGMPEIVRGKTGGLGRIIYAGRHYVYQPLDAKDERIPLVYRHLPASAQIRLVPMVLDAEGSETSHASAISDILADIDSKPDILLQHRVIDYALSTQARVVLLEHIIAHRTHVHLLQYFKNFLLFDDGRNPYGHFLSEMPRCWNGQEWAACGLAEKRSADAARAELYREPEASFVGYVESRGGVSSFKIVNNHDQNDKTRLDLQVAQNTLTKGKQCTSYDRVGLNLVARELAMNTESRESKVAMCERLEYSFRKAQHASTGIRYFYNAIETQQRQGLLQSKQL
ncbi:hypothetical protein CVIRNUC_003635 [Coccomyxa viridis]|uniref:Helicase ATP-binding domain-containing protein n=1 Tax=Coccomyxa viridis TaxID=1274662 RepID=A0AAV1I1U8_9CHLO|nr:hypothetical protein CVIRNUC_003635 [Coccomyxa viridis]